MMTIKVHNSNKKTLYQNDTRKELPGFYVTAGSTSDTECDSVTLSHILYMCEAMIWFFFLEDRKKSASFMIFTFIAKCSLWEKTVARLESVV